MEIIEQVPRKSVGPTEISVLRSRLIAARTAAEAAQVPQRARSEATDIPEAVPHEDLVLFAETMVQPNVERILIIHSIRI